MILFNNDVCDNNNSAFAKIDIHYDNQKYVSKNVLIDNLSFYNTPINHLKKLEVLFRYHDNVMLDFNNSEYNFTLEINMLNDNPNNISNVSIPKLLNI